ncbi:type II secretion system protein GspK [Tardiphaga robiniae]|uniref:General secretion pathway protein GspK n=1 Tax=Tardiphaga robiniae TaxID=943830 RepID=A0A7G6TUM2_9BRAD|nr:type II secretion system protein GspK [Tardiphaga robiniae]QND70454.1 general secretion pathway protein GspK [Tardiphaga robiniae]
MLLGTVLMVGARYRSRSDASLASSERAAAAAESAVHLAIMIALARRTGAAMFPLSCTMPDGARATITMTVETGKLDLNAGSARSLTALFSGLANDRTAGERIAAGIATARDPRSADAARSPGNVQIGFKSILELDRIPGVTPNLLRAALPLLTVRSGRTEPDPALASATMRDLLGLADAPVQDLAASDITIRADVSVGKNGRFIRDALVSLRPDAGRLFAIREWRRSDVPPGDMPGTGPTSLCLDALQVGS